MNAKTAAMTASWLLCLIIGFGMLFTYQKTPGQTGVFPEKWPESSPLRRVPGKMTLLLFAHLRCACTRSAAESLAWILSRTEKRIDAHVVLFEPTETARPLLETNLTPKFNEIPGVEIRADKNGAEIRRFKVKTSGSVALYDEAGVLIFGGGITAGRGHDGDNAGRDAVAALANGKDAAHAYPVFGCSFSETTVKRP